MAALTIDTSIKGGRSVGGDSAAAANILTLPSEKAVHTAFPPSCPVLLVRSSTATAAGGAGGEVENVDSPVVLQGRVSSVFVDLFSSSREDRFVVEVERRSDDDRSDDENSREKKESIVATKDSLHFGPRCTVHLRPFSGLAIPPGVQYPSGEGDARVEGIIIATYRGAAPGGGGGGGSGAPWVYSVRVTVDGTEVVHHCVPREYLSYRHVPAAEDQEEEEEEAASACKMSKEAGDDERLSVAAPDSARLHPRPASLEAPPVSKRRKLDADDGGDDSTVHIRRIDIPNYLSTKRLLFILIGKGGETQKQLQQNLKCYLHIFHDLPGGAGRLDLVEKRYGDLCPASLGRDKAVMIRGSTREGVEHAVSVVVPILAEGFAGWRDKERLRQVFLQSVRGTTLEDDDFVRPEASCDDSSPQSELGTIPAPDPTAGGGEFDVHVRRIIVPVSLPNDKVSATLIGPRGSLRTALMKNMRAQFWVYHSGSPRKPQHRALYGELMPSIGQRCIMLRAANASIADNAVEVIIDKLCDEKDNELRALLSSVSGTIVEDKHFVDPANGEYDQDERSNVVFTFNTDDLDYHKDESLESERRIDVPDWMDPHETLSSFIGSGGSKIKRLGAATRCKIQLRGKGTTCTTTSDEESLYILIVGNRSGDEEERLDKACVMVEDALLETVDECEHGHLLYDIEAFRKYRIRNASLRSQGGPPVYQRLNGNSDDRVWMNYVAIPVERARELDVDIVRELLGEGGRRNKEMRKSSRCRIDILGIGRGKKGQGPAGQCPPYALVSGPSERAVDHGVDLVRSFITKTLSAARFSCAGNRGPPPTDTDRRPPVIDNALSSAR